MIVGSLDHIGTTLGIKENPSESRTNDATQGNPSNNNFDNRPHFNRPHDNAAGIKSSRNRDLSSMETGQHYDYLLVGPFKAKVKSIASAGNEAAMRVGERFAALHKVTQLQKNRGPAQRPKSINWVFDRVYSAFRRRLTKR